MTVQIDTLLLEAMVCVAICEAQHDGWLETLPVKEPRMVAEQNVEDIERECEKRNFNFPMLKCLVIRWRLKRIAGKKDVTALTNLQGKVLKLADSIGAEGIKDDLHILFRSIRPV